MKRSGRRRTCRSAGCCSPRSATEARFEIVNHLNYVAELITDVAERQQLIRLNLEAGRRARAAMALDVAHNYFRTAQGLLAEDVWKAEYALCFNLYAALAECA